MKQHGGFTVETSRHRDGYFLVSVTIGPNLELGRFIAWTAQTEEEAALGGWRWLADRLFQVLDESDAQPDG